jgi:uncharacterized protein (TIGR00369 family)
MLIQEPALWRDVPVRGEVLDASTRSLSGLEVLHQLREAPPMGRLTGVRFDGADEGTASFSMPVSPWFQWSAAGVPGGVLALSADAALGCALQTLVPAHTQYTTAEMSMTYIRPIRVGSVVSVRGHALYSGRTMGLSEGQVVDDQGRLIAHTTSRMRIFGDPAAGAPSVGGTAAPPSVAVPASADAGPDPYLRPIPDTQVDPEEVRSLRGIEVIRAQMHGDLPLPPMHHLLGLVPTEANEGSAACALPLSPWLATPFGWPQGGFIVLLSDLTLALAVQTTLGAGERMASVDIKVNFLRPVAGDGTTIEARARVVHRGRSLAVSTAEVVAADGRTVALATGSAALLGN